MWESVDGLGSLEASLVELSLVSAAAPASAAVGGAVGPTAVLVGRRGVQPLVSVLVVSPPLLICDTRRCNLYQFVFVFSKVPRKIWTFMQLAGKLSKNC